MFRKPLALTEFQKQEAVKLFDEGHGANRIALMLRCSVWRLECYLASIGKKRTPEEALAARGGRNFNWKTPKILKTN